MQIFLHGVKYTNGKYKYKYKFPDKKPVPLVWKVLLENKWRKTMKGAAV